MASTGLSKSLLLKGLQCPRALWLAKHPPAFVFPLRPELEAKFAAGTAVGQLAQQLFPGGVEVPYEGLSVPAQIARTRELIDAGAEVIYEASFSFSAVFVKVDLLIRDGDAWRIYEVKMGTSVKEVNLDDVAIQQYVLEGCGLTVSRCFLVHIDNSYVRQGAVEVDRLFHAEEITPLAAARRMGLHEVIADLRQVVSGTREPAIEIGPQCHDPYECDFIPWCWRHIPENSIFDLRGNGVKKWELYRQGIVRFEEIPLPALNPAQRQQVEATLNEEDHLDAEAVRAFLATLWYPLVHLDFETFASPIPPFDGTRPYQQVPFQFSAHRQAARGAEPEHADFLAEPGSDPRRALAEALLEAIPVGACVLTYNQAFERGVLRELAALFPDLAEPLTLIHDNVRDLMLPFRKRHVYRWTMRGSYSIKQVLPAMVPELSYEGMEVADGEAAMRAFQTLGELPPGEEREALRQALLDYCRMDTWGMVKILEELEKLAPRPSA